MIAVWVIILVLVIWIGDLSNRLWDLEKKLKDKIEEDEVGY